MKALNLKKIGERIRDYREAAGFSQSDISLKTKLDKARISNIESGRGNPTIQTISKIANALNVTIDDLLEYEMCDERKLLIIAVNKLLENNKITLDYCENNNLEEEGCFITDIAGYKSAIIWGNISHGELEIKIWWNFDENQFNKDYNNEEPKPLCGYHDLNRFTGCEVQGWLERKNGKYLQGEGKRGILRRYLSNKMRAELKKIKNEKPQGYEAEGKFYM